MKPVSIFLMLLIFTAISVSAARLAHAEFQVKLESPLHGGDEGKMWCDAFPEDSEVMTVSDGSHPPIVPEVGAVTAFRNSHCGTTFGTHIQV